jgi:imidazole glycerol-phosphate synthase subunit HisH
MPTLPDGPTTRRVTIFDYGAGNLHSLAKAVSTPGVAVRIESDPRAMLETDLLILPGVGAFSPAAERLALARDAVRDALDGGLPCLGICLGMQLMFEGSDEGPGAGIGLFSGRVTRLRAARLPHIGWNTLTDRTDPLLVDIGLTDTYYAHSYAFRPENADIVTAWTTVEDDRFGAVVRSRNTIGVQFHPEKSSAPGVRFIRAACRMALEGAPTR